MGNNNMLTYTIEVEMTPQERCRLIDRRAREIYAMAIGHVSNHTTDALTQRGGNPVNIDEYPAKIAAISRQILILQDNIAAISETWRPIRLRHKQEIDAQTVKVSNSRGVEVEKPAYPNEEARETELMARMARYASWSRDMLQIVAIERAVKDLKILRRQVSDEFKVARLHMEQEISDARRTLGATA